MFYRQKNKNQELINQIKKLQEAETAAKERLAAVQLELGEAKIQIKLAQQESQFHINQIKHNAEMEAKNLRAEMQQAKKLSEEKSKHTEEMLISNHKNKLDEALALMKLDFQQKSAQEKVNFDKKVAELCANHAKQVGELTVKFEREQANFQKKIQEDTFKTLSETMKEISTRGNAQTEFMKDTAMLFMDRATGFKKSTAEYGKPEGNSSNIVVLDAPKSKDKKKRE